MVNHFVAASFSIRKFRLIGHFVLVLMPMKPVFIGSIGILRFSVILKGWTKRVGKKFQTPCKYGLKWYFIFPRK